MSDELGQIVIGDRFGDRMIIELLDRMHPDAEDYWDGNWLVAKLDVHAGPWSGTMSIGLHVVELRKLRGVLIDIYDHLHRTARYDSMEEDFRLEFIGNGRGQIEIRGAARDPSRNEISFRYGVDQSYLPRLIEQVFAAENLFPVVGRP